MHTEKKMNDSSAYGHVEKVTLAPGELERALGVALDAYWDGPLMPPTRNGFIALVLRELVSGQSEAC